MKRIALLLAAVAVGLGTFVLVRMARDGSDQAATRPVSGHDAGEKSAGLPIPDRAGRPGQPDRPDKPDKPDKPDTGPPGPGQRSFTFEEEERDATWADEHEQEMTLRVRKLIDGIDDVDVDRIECRRSLCRISLHARDVPALSKLYGALETPDGLYGWADNVLLESVETESDGRVKTSVTAVFNRE